MTSVKLASAEEIKNSFTCSVFGLRTYDLEMQLNYSALGWDPSKQILRDIEHSTCRKATALVDFDRSISPRGYETEDSDASSLQMASSLRYGLDAE